MSGDDLPDELTEAPGRPKDTTWGLFGEGDRLGTLNLLTPERVVAAARLVRTGRRFNLNLPLNEPPRPAEGKGTRGSYRHEHRRTVSPSGVVDPTSTEEVIDNLNTQSSTQWDGFSHVQHPRLGWYGGAKPGDLKPGAGSRHSIGAWTEAGGIVGRGVLADLPRGHAALGLPYDAGKRIVVEPATLERILAWEGVTVGAGDILLVRTGAITALRRGGHPEGTPGIGPGREMSAWLWKHRVAAVAGDTGSFEPSPIDQSGPRSMHMALIPMLGMPIGELFDLEALADECARTKVYEFLFVSMPLNLPGGVASPPNAVAIT